MWRTVGVATATCVDADIASTAAHVCGGSSVAWPAESGLPARLVAWGGLLLGISDWRAEPGRQPEALAR